MASIAKQFALALIKWHQADLRRVNGGQTLLSVFVTFCSLSLFTISQSFTPSFFCHSLFLSPCRSYWEHTWVTADLCNKRFTMQITSTDADWSKPRVTDLRDLTKCSREFCQVVCGRSIFLDESSLESLPFIRTALQIWADYQMFCINITSVRNACRWTSENALRCI